MVRPLRIEYVGEYSVTDTVVSVIPGSNKFNYMDKTYLVFTQSMSSILSLGLYLYIRYIMCHYQWGWIRRLNRIIMAQYNKDIMLYLI